MKPIAGPAEPSSCVIRPLCTADERQQYARLCDFCFHGSSGGYVEKKSPEEEYPYDWMTNSSHMLAAFVPDISPVAESDGEVAEDAKPDQTLVAAMTHFEMSLLMRGATFRSSSIAGVVSSPGYRNRGHVRELFRRHLAACHESGRAVSALFPFKFSYYERLGHVLADENTTCVFRPQDITLSRSEHTVVMVEVLDVEKKLNFVNTIYPKWLEKQGIDFATGQRPDDVLRVGLRDKFFFVAVDAKSRSAVGYVSFRLETKYHWVSKLYRGVVTPKVMDTEGGVLKISEATWLDIGVKEEIFRFLRSHRDQVGRIVWMTPSWINVKDYLTDLRFLRMIESWSMFRVVDVETVLSKIKVADAVTCDVVMSVSDELCPWNNGGFRIRKESGTTSLSIDRVEKAVPDVSLSIQQLGVLVCGNRLASRMEGRWNVKADAAVIKVLDAMFPTVRAFFNESF